MAKIRIPKPQGDGQASEEDLLAQAQIELEDGTVMDLNEAERRIKFDAANTQRAQDVAKRQEQLDEREARLFSILEEAAKRQPVAPAAVETAQDQAPKMSVHDALKESEQLVANLRGLDFVGDATAVDRLTAALTQSNRKIAEAAAADNQAVMEVFKKDSARLEARLVELSRKQEEAVATSQVQNTRRDAATAADERNDRLMKQVLAKPEYDRLALTEQEIQAVKEVKEGLLHKRYGEYDATSGRWLWNDKATEDAMRLVPSIQEKMDALTNASVRNETLEARQRGNRASRSTPLRGRPAVSDNGNDFNEKLQEIAAGLESGQISPQAALKALNPEERQRFMQMRRQAQERSKG